MTTITLTMRRPDDMHVHLREGDLLRKVLPYTAYQFKRALVMPNLSPNAIVSGASAENYREEILKLSEGTGFEPLMTIKLTQKTSPSDIRGSRPLAIAAKLYPEGVTTNSSNGVTDLSALTETFKAMEDYQMVLCIHAEEPGVFSLQREQAFLGRIRRLIDNHPKLKIVIEHVTTKEAVQFVLSAPPNVAATITVHHLLITLDDVIGDGGINPHHFCKPIAKHPEDRKALREVATSGNPKFFLGTDSAPHVVERKECSHGCAGVFSAPVALPLLVQVFDEDKSLDALEAFVSENGANFYGLPLNKELITLTKMEWQVPQHCVDVVPFKAGEKLQWSIPMPHDHVSLYDLLDNF